mmetsp:Transcript_21521/g.27147  ORF Transcript_21521/g.27147 Transcript_21521/m.27147 type:complete len:124 (+) Transcript_21521:431-802(+)
MLQLAKAYVNAAVISDDLSFAMIVFETNECITGKNSPPMVMAIMSDEKTQPVGTPPGGSMLRRVGTHMKTNVYIAPSLSACVKPILQILESVQVALHPSVNCAYSDDDDDDESSPPPPFFTSP